MLSHLLLFSSANSILQSSLSLQTSRCAQHALGEGVLPFGTVHGDDGDAVLYLRTEVRVPGVYSPGHCLLLCDRSGWAMGCRERERVPVSILRMMWMRAGDQHRAS